MVRSVVGVAALLMAGCSGQLLIESAGLGDGTCVTSAPCGLGRVCVAGQCVESEGRCSPSRPDGDCDTGRVCEGGFCVLEDDDGSNLDPDGPFDCSQCSDGQLCGIDRCIEPTDTAEVCSPSVPAGACPPSEVCVAGSCTRIVPGVNDCAEERPSGLCPPGGACENGFCVPIAERPCSGAVTDGLCPAGQLCIDGGCEVVECAEPDVLFGACPGSQVCIDGECLPPTVLGCDTLDCASLNRAECSVGEDGLSRCGGCVAGFAEDGFGQCVSEGCIQLNCGSDFRECVVTDGVASCEQCRDGFLEADGESQCVAARCSDLDCSAERRECVEEADEATPSSCGGCLGGFQENDDGTCPSTCAEVGSTCANQNRTCVDDPETGAACGECVNGATVAANGQCVVCDTGDCAACESTQDCIDAGNGGYCNASTRLCTIECGLNGAVCPAGAFECSPNNRCAQVSPGGDLCGAGLADEGELIKPLVYLLVDRSGTMDQNFNLDGNTIRRWFAVETILFGGSSTTSCSGSRQAVDDDDADGLVTELQNDIQFGLATYSTNGSPPSRTLEMNYAGNPASPPPLGNRDALAADYAAQCWDGGTPTAEAYDDLLDNVLLAQQAIETSGDPVPPTFVVLATDGQPDSTFCSEDGNSTAEWAVLDVAARAFEQGITTFALSVGTNLVRNHLQDLANVGIGAPALGPLDFDTYTSPRSVDGPTCSDESLSGSDADGIRVALDRTCQDLDGEQVGSGNECLESCDSRRMRECDAQTFSDYQGTYGVQACSSTEGVDLDSDDVPELAPCYIGSNGAQLRSALSSVFDTVQTCLIQLDTTGEAILNGTVFFDDDVIQQGTDWVVRGLDQIEIIGARCDELKDGEPHFVTVEINSCSTGG